MATATTAPEMEFRALLARVRQGPDEAAAAAVTAFVGDINACPMDETVLHVAVYCGHPLTIAALAARGDCNPNVITRIGVPTLYRVISLCSDQTDIAAFLAHFPTLDIDACDSTTGRTPLHYAALFDRKAHLRLLLDAGADPTIRSLEGRTPAQVAHRLRHTHCTELLEAAEAWHNSLRRRWLRAVVGISKI